MSMILKRRPTLVDSLRKLNLLLLQCGCVIDVGVERQTAPLMAAYPQLKHYLFEPVKEYAEDIHRNYSNIDHALYAARVSDRTAEDELTLDSVLSDMPERPFLLKIDVDGPELRVLAGAAETLKHTSVVIIEATLGQLPDICNHLQGAGFRLFDIVDLSYYRGVLWQVDLVFLPARTIEIDPRYNPLPFDRPIDPKEWFTTGHE